MIGITDHFSVHLKLTQHCKSTILLKKEESQCDGPFSSLLSRNHGCPWEEGPLCQLWGQLAHQVKRTQRKVPSQPTMDTQSKEEISPFSVTPLRYLEAVFYSNITYSALNDLLGARIRGQHPPVSLLNLSSVSLSKTGKRLNQLPLLEAHDLELLDEEFPSDETIPLKPVPFSSKILPPLFPSRT